MTANQIMHFDPFEGTWFERAIAVQENLLAQHLYADECTGLPTALRLALGTRTMVKSQRKKDPYNAASSNELSQMAAGAPIRTNFWERLSGTVRRSKKKVALVIGNSNYQRATYLDSPAHDAEAVAKKLEELGFSVSLGTDLSHAETNGYVQNFLAQEVPNADVALLYYSGHGAQYEGENYFIPIDVNPDDEIRIHELNHVGPIVEEISGHAKLTVVILDACRTNPVVAKDVQPPEEAPLASLKGAAPGLAWMDAAQDVYIAFAAAPGKIAYGGTGKLSPFTEALVQFLPTRGLELDDLFRRVRDAVKEATSNRQSDKQIPWSNSAVGKTDFFFKPRSYWPMIVLAALGLASGILSAMAASSLRTEAADYVPGLLLGIAVGSALFGWGAPGVKCLMGAAFAALAWMVVILAFDYTFYESSLFRPKEASSTPPWLAKWPGPKPQAWKLPTTKPLSAPDMMNKLIGDIKTNKTGKGYDYYKGVSPHLQQHNTELETLSRAYTDLFRSVKRMLFGILGSVLVFSAFSAPFPWLRRAQAIGLAAGGGAIAAIILGATTLSGKEASLSGPAFQIPWQTSLGAVVGYAVVHYVPDIPWVRKTLFPKPSSWKPIAWLTLGGTLAGAVSSIILFFIVPENTKDPDLTHIAALACPGAALVVAGFLIFARASGARCLVLAVSLLVAWIAAYEIILGRSDFDRDMSVIVVLTFIFLAGGAMIEPRLRQPSVWLVALLATAATGVLNYMIFHTNALEILTLGSESDKNIWGYATLNMCVGAAIGYGLSLPHNLAPIRSRP